MRTKHAPSLNRPPCRTQQLTAQSSTEPLHITCISSVLVCQTSMSAHPTMPRIDTALQHPGEAPRFVQNLLSSPLQRYAFHVVHFLCSLVPRCIWIARHLGRNPPPATDVTSGSCPRYVLLVPYMYTTATIRPKHADRQTSQ